MGAACSATNNVVVPVELAPEERQEVLYRTEPVAVVGVRGIRSLRESGSEYWGEKYVGDM